MLNESLSGIALTVDYIIVPLLIYMLTYAILGDRYKYIRRVLNVFAIPLGTVGYLSLIFKTLPDKWMILIEEVSKLSYFLIWAPSCIIGIFIVLGCIGAVVQEITKERF